ncbi:hypothetical protein [Robertkochia solimangrovi]|uniref:hypothetical protein n=1 Tax=Robertkochia solimangrovi TaxID=2213046 RepID=UPI00117E0658|nr:hypothetical protein [Robertkochia solimangrovi]TRZ43992.1 hypothetical protein DMZ48_08555 [Robertkochia solimangrovi]
MKRINLILLLLTCFISTHCTTEKHQFPLDKRYWDLVDYEASILELNYGYDTDEKLPNFNDPETRLIVEKLTDHQNFKVVLDDEELGLKHRNEYAQKFFTQWKNMSKIYKDQDRKDQYLYDKEMLAVWHFGLDLQVRYFTLANTEIKESADDPNASKVSYTLNKNLESMINNYLIYMDELNNEKAFSEEGKEILAEGIDTYFTELVEIYPEANFDKMKKKAELMLKKSESDKVKSSLERLIDLIDSKKTANL